VLRDPRSYEALDPAAFGAQRTLDIAHALTGRHAVQHRAVELGVTLSPAQLAQVTTLFKDRAARMRVGLADLDAAIRAAAEPVALAAAL
jgi:homocitrate synthase